jgi:cytochrome b pre-mRNA-processing protein 3
MRQARLPAFYLEGGVSDDFDGRFECLALHAYLVLRRLRREGEPASRLAQAFADRVFRDFDDIFREMGIGDEGVSRRVRKMAESFYGRVSAYEAAMAAAEEEGGDPLHGPLSRNLYGGREVGAATLAAMAAYVRAQDEHLGRQPLSQLQVGVVDFLTPAEFEGGPRDDVHGR